MTSGTPLGEILLRMGRSLPSGSVFTFAMEADIVRLGVLSIPVEGRGVGTRFLADVLAATDDHGFATALQADPSDEPDDPSTYDLVRWYSRLGFGIEGLDEDLRLAMSRPARVPAVDAEAILQDYALAEGFSPEAFDAAISDTGRSTAP